MNRRDALLTFGGALGVAAARPALAALPMPDLDTLHPDDVVAHIRGVRSHLHGIAARPQSAQMHAYLGTLGLPGDIVGRTLRAMAATSAFRELSPAAQAHPAAQALVREEALGAGEIAILWSKFLIERGADCLDAVGEALRARPDLGEALREQFHVATAELGSPEPWTRALDARLEKTLWRLRHQSGRGEAEDAVLRADKHWRAAGLDPDELRADAHLDLASPDESDDVDEDAPVVGPITARRAKRRHAGLVTMAVGGGAFALAVTAALLIGNPTGTTIMVVIGLPGLAAVLIGLILYLSAIGD